ncbi:hypothetical protein KCU93_g179, partial [Aureobasidium melanogenum]
MLAYTTSFLPLNSATHTGQECFLSIAEPLCFFPMASCSTSVLLALCLKRRSPCQYHRVSIDVLLAVLMKHSVAL